MERDELIRSKEFWLVQIQNNVFNLIDNYRKEKKLTQTQIATHLKVTKGYVSQILNGDYDHKVSKLVELSLAFNKAPVLIFRDLDKFIQDDKDGINCLENQHHESVNYWVSLNSNTVIKIDPKLNSEFEKRINEYFYDFHSIDMPSKTEISNVQYVNYSELIGIK